MVDNFELQSCLDTCMYGRIQIKQTGKWGSCLLNLKVTHTVASVSCADRRVPYPKDAQK